MPESSISGRNRHKDSASPPSDEGGEGDGTRAELRLRVLNSLPQSHQRYLFEEIRKSSIQYLRSKQVAASEVTPEELLSEIWKKLLGHVSLQDSETPLSFDLFECSTDPHAPDRDGRVVWLIREIGGFEAIGHRHEDLLRQRFGRSVPGRGRRIVQPDDDDGTFENPFDLEPEQGGALHDADTRLIWRGLIAMARRRFRPDDDVSTLLRLMGESPGLFDGATGGQWPISDIVAMLNVRFSDPAWHVDRVDNAKRRLVNWIKRLMEKNRLDVTDLEALFARVARQEEGSEQEVLTDFNPPHALS